MLDSVVKRTADRDISLEFTDRFKERVVREGNNPRFGARPLRRTIQRLVEDVVAETVLDGFLIPGDVAIVDCVESHQSQETANAVVVSTGRGKRRVEVSTTAGIEQLVSAKQTGLPSTSEE